MISLQQLDSPPRVSASIHPDSVGLRGILPYITPHRRALFLSLALLLAVSAIALANPWLAGMLTASVIGDTEHNTTTLLAIWAAAMCLRSALSFCSAYFIGSTGERLTAEMRERLYTHLQALPVSYYQQRRRGDTLALLGTDAEIISRFVTQTLVQLLPAGLTFAGALSLMAWLDMTIALLAVLLLPAYFLAIKIVGRRLRQLSHDWLGANSNLLSVVEENLGMLPAIKAFTREPHEQHRFTTANRKLLGISRRQLALQSMLSPVTTLLGALGVLALLWVGTGHVASGQLSPAELVTLLLYALLLVSPMATLADVYGQVQYTRGSAQRILDFLAQQREPVDTGKRTMEAVSGHIKFENVSFGYPSRPGVLRGLDLDIEAGETVAITGPNGVGKSTLAHLLLRFSDPDSGRITVDGYDLREITLTSLRARIGLVAQHILLLNGSVAENISYGMPAAGRRAIELAANRAHADTFIEQLPEKYDTVIGDQGVKLSGGQRQRLSLARALLKDPPILILDEATAMFDPEAEQAFIKTCQGFLTPRTVILITHRPASLALADRVINLAQTSPGTQAE